MTADDLESLCKRLAPELGDVPLYVAFASQMPDALAAADGYLGVATPTLDLMLRAHLPARGRGPCMLLNDQGIRQEAQELSSGFGWPEEQTFAWCLVRVAVHETAHILGGEPPYYQAVAEDCMPPILPVSRVAEILAVPSDEPPVAGAPPWLGHGLAFVRIALHLRFRAERLGFKFTPYNLIDHNRFGLSHSHRYLVALGDEPERTAGSAFAEIAATPPPAAFAALWQDDVDHYFREERAPVKILDSLLSKLTKRARDRDDSFLGLARQIADGQEPDAAQAETTLRQSGKTAEDLRAAVEWLLKRRELAAKVARAEGAHQEREKISANVAGLDVELKKAQDRHAEAVAPLAARLRELVQFEGAALEAKAELMRTIDDDLRSRFKDLEQRERVATQQHRELAERVNQAKIAARTARDWAAYDHDYDKRSCLTAAENAEVRAQQHAAELQPVERELQEMAAEREKLDQLALVP